MERRTFLKGTLATAAVAAIPAFGMTPNSLSTPIWLAEGEGWRQVVSFADIKKGDIFVPNWPMRDEATSDGSPDGEYIHVNPCSVKGPRSNPPYPWCNRCKDIRVVPPSETTDVVENDRVICEKCVADPGYAERRHQEAIEWVRRNPSASLK